MEKIRIQKLIADSGYCSRRKAEDLISKGRVKLNGRPVKLGDKASARDIITIDGERIYVPKTKKFVYIMMNKPRGYVTTMSDELGRKCVNELLEGVNERVYPVGRLDRNSEGLLLFTNDGNFANGIMHPAKQISKTYRVTVRPDINDEQLVALADGIDLDGKKTLPATVIVKDKEPGRVVLLMTIKEGRNRQIRRNFEGYEDIINKIGREELRIIESFSNGMVDGYGIYAVYPEQITIYDFDGNDFDIIDGIIRTILFKGQFKGINSCEFKLVDNDKNKIAADLNFIENRGGYIRNIDEFMNNCKKCKELR